MAVSLSHRFFVLLLRLTGGRKILGKQFAKGRSATAAPKPKGMSAYNISESEFKGQPVWTYAGDDTLIYYLHGGGFILGFSPLYFSMMGGIATAAKATLVAPDYPLPPDATAMETHGWMRAHFMETVEALKPKRVIIMGDSAGGNLAIGLADWLITNGHKAPDKLILLAPWVDLEMEGPDAELSSGEQLLVHADLRAAGKRYAGELGVKDPLISPIFAKALALPETHIFTGDQDPLHPDIIRFAAKYPKAQIDLAENLPHVYMLMPTKEAKGAFQRIAAAING
ncbi:alpha/beta hydrolase fold domain-containing protein [Hellea balneolensis]|uniref:alpha/beta hydrolase fold domain-containing protein n=1 Tax=Hellea balneolensis TaxID=287478 RepID=UPI000421B159|nr:alpha/beta hydrolase fold domain-containing protein [Hellea balneolensis]